MGQTTGHLTPCAARTAARPSYSCAATTPEVESAEIEVLLRGTTLPRAETTLAAARRAAPDLHWGTPLPRWRAGDPLVGGMLAGGTRAAGRLIVSQPLPDRSLAARLALATRLSLIGETLARRRDCVAIRFGSAPALSPEDWRLAADRLRRGGVPVTAWIDIDEIAAEEPGVNAPLTLQSRGLALFTGAEVMMPSVPLPWNAARRWVIAALRLILEQRAELADGMTIGADDDVRRVRMRLIPAGRLGREMPTWVLLHPQSTLDEAVLFGARDLPVGMVPPVWRRAVNALVGRLLR